MMGYDPQNSTDVVVTTEEEKNQAVRNEFSKLKDKKLKKPPHADGSNYTDSDQLNEAERDALEDFQDAPKHSQYTEKETKDIIHKVSELKKGVKFSAHKTDFTQPLKPQDVEGNRLLTLQTMLLNWKLLAKTAIRWA